MDFNKYHYPKSFPEIVSFLVTNKCVCRCKHCFNWAQASSRGAIGNTNKRDLTTKEYEKILKGFDPVEYAYIGGGEPFIRPDIAEVLEIIYSYTKPKVINISTNGQFLQNTSATLEKLLNKFSELKLVLKISIDGIESDHDEIRQKKGAFATAMQTYQACAALREKFQNLHLGITTVLSGFNQDKVLPLYQHIRNLSPRPDCITQLLVRANPKVGSSKERLDLAKYQEWTRRYCKDMLDGKFEEDLLVKAATILMYEYVYKTVKEKKASANLLRGYFGRGD